MLSSSIVFGRTGVHRCSILPQIDQSGLREAVVPLPMCAKEQTPQTQGTVALSCVLPQADDVGKTMSMLTAYMHNHELMERLRSRTGMRTFGGSLGGCRLKVGRPCFLAREREQTGQEFIGDARSNIRFVQICVVVVCPQVVSFQGRIGSPSAVSKEGCQERPPPLNDPLF